MVKKGKPGERNWIASDTEQSPKDYLKATINRTQQNSRCRFCGDCDDKINHIISECSKLTQREYNTKPDWVGKMIHWELCKKIKFDLTNKWFIPNPESFLENETQKILWDFEIQTDHLLSVRRPGLVIVKKNLVIPTDLMLKLEESEKGNKCLDLARELKKTRKQLWLVHLRNSQRNGKEARRTRRDHPDYSTIKIG